MSHENGNEAWDAYLESVQYGLDYVLGMCKCLCRTVYLYHKEKVCNITPCLTLDVTDFETRKRREGVGDESDDKLDSSAMSDRRDGGGVGGGVGEVLVSQYTPHSLFVGSAAPAHVAIASLHLASCNPLATTPHPPVALIHSLLFTLCSHSSWAFPRSWQFGEVWLGPHC